MITAPLLPFAYILRNMRVCMAIGIHSEERAPQPLLVSVRAQGLAAAHPCSIAEALDYQPVHDHVQHNWPQRPHTDLLETLALDLLQHIFADPRITTATIGLLKPSAFPNTEAAGIELTLTRTEWTRLHAL